MWVYIFYLYHVLSTFLRVSYLRNLLITISYHCLDQKHCPCVVLVNHLKRIFLVLLVLLHIVRKSKCNSINITWVCNNIFIKSIPSGEFVSYYNIVFFMSFFFHPQSHKSWKLWIQCIVCVIYLTKIRRYVILYNWNKQYFFAHIESKN